MRRLPFLLGAVIALTGCAPQAEPDEELSGGATTVFDDSRDAFGHPTRDISSERRRDFLVGNSFFTDPWVTAPGSVDTRDGLGPVFNANACAACHARDGRGRPPEDDQEMVSALVRISIPGESANGGPLPVPSYGDQIQPRAIAGVVAEASTRVTWEPVEGTYGDGEPYTLRRPVLEIRDPAFGPLPAELLTSLRVAPPTVGLGLLECVPSDSIEALADPDDADADGVSGRVNHVWDASAGALALGRFGWKANQPSLSQQDRGAFLGDMGITSDMFPDGECASGQDECAAAIPGGSPQARPDVADLVDLYVRLLAPPARRDVDDPDVIRGRDLFDAFGCATCHVRVLETGACDGFPELENQHIRPLTDLLVHDMGEELADGRPDFEASGSEWRTPPLWGLGLTETVSDHDRMLHDGRARGAAEAILWHGGEAEPAREAFRTATATERAELLAYLGSL